MRRYVVTLVLLVGLAGAAYLARCAPDPPCHRGPTCQERHG